MYPPPPVRPRKFVKIIKGFKANEEIPEESRFLHQQKEITGYINLGTFGSAPNYETIYYYEVLVEK